MRSTSQNPKEALIRDFRIRPLCSDFMGYIPEKLSYHHLIVPKRLGGPRTYTNGAILSSLTSHEYLHKIELTDPEVFHIITELMIHEKEMGRLDPDTIKKIHMLLEYVERSYPKIVKETYLVKRRTP